MKRWIHTIFVILSSFVAASTASLATLCPSCTSGSSGSPSDVFYEDWNGSNSCGNTISNSGTAPTSNCDCTWTFFIENTGNTINPMSTRNLSSLSCVNKGTYDIDFYQNTGTVSGTIGIVSALRTFSAATTMYAQAYICVESISIPGGGAAYVMDMGNVSSPNPLQTIAACVYWNGINFVWDLEDQAYANYISSVVVVPGTWYRIGLEWHQNTINGAKLWVNGVNVASCNAENQSVVYLELGDDSGQGSNTERFQVANVQVDDTAMPGACYTTPASNSSSIN